MSRKYLKISKQVKLQKLKICRLLEQKQQYYY